VELYGPHDAHLRGVWTVFQELTLLPWMTVAENLLLRDEPRGPLGLIHRRRLARDADAALARLGIRHIDPHALVEDISLAERQIVEIARVVLRDPAILLLDEPTSSLGEHEVAWLFGLIRDLRARGKCIVFTSHRWNEIASIADRITIFRNGAEVGTYREIGESEAVTLMTGQRLDTLFPPLPPLRAEEPMLEVKDLTAPGIRGVGFTLRQGEILGIGGLTGHGHRELFLTLFGAERAEGGTIVAGGERLRLRGYFAVSIARATARWFKHVASFEGWLDYIVRKASRHTGQSIELSARERRWPLVFLWGRVFRYLRRKGRGQQAGSGGSLP